MQGLCPSGILSSRTFTTARAPLECDLREWQIPVVRKKSIRAA
jgi:hypothetical protein